MRREGADIQSDVPTRSRSRARRDTATSTFRTNQDTDGSALSRDRRLVSPRPPDAACDRTSPAHPESGCFPDDWRNSLFPFCAARPSLRLSDNLSLNGPNHMRTSITMSTHESQS